MAIVKYRNFEKNVDVKDVQYYIAKGYTLIEENPVEAVAETIEEVVETAVKKPLSKMKIDELKAIAHERGIEGYESLTKAELLEVLK